MMNLNKNTLTKLSLICLSLALILFAVSYYFFHFVTDDGFTLTWHPEAGKPYVSEMLGDLSVLFLFASAFSFISSRVLFESRNDASTKSDKDGNDAKNG